jgi:hypothetical protein
MNQKTINFINMLQKMVVNKEITIECYNEWVESIITYPQRSFDFMMDNRL